MSRDSTSTPPRLSGLERRVIGLLLVAAFVVILNETIMGVALPMIMEELSITAATGQWLSTAFMLTMAIVAPTTGYILQRFRLRPVFITAMSLFTTGTLIAGLSSAFAPLLLGRIVQASGTAIMMPLLMTTILTIVPPASRGRIMGAVSIVISVAPAIGPTVSGFILQSLSWQWLFLSVLPVAVIALVLGLIWLRNITETRPGHLDIPSVGLSVLAFGGIIFGLSSFGEAAGGEQLLSPWIPLGAGLVALALFIWRQLALAPSGRALLDLRAFARPVFRLNIAVIVIVMFALFGSIIVLPIYLQTVLGLSTLQTGLMLLPGGIVMGVMAPFVGRAFDRIGARPLVIPGSIIAAAALWGLASLTEASDPLMVIAVHVVLNIGLALMFTPLMTSALGSLPHELYSHGSAIFGTIQQLAAAAGTAIFITVMSLASAGALESGAEPLAATEKGIQAAFLTGAIVATVTVVVTLFVRKSVPEAADATPAEDADSALTASAATPATGSIPVVEAPERDERG
ncbi:MDR family MFS transporter [Mycetocola reblochoni]|uniref:DHA2 family efflux MFS transporter permease subunit n=2 Tax=Mycetocola reblochoni TaxID=331618 RepID=A0A3L6ZU97_9MICO|nr:MDR family MFS transporter [Mycetocola reblochoni]RLP71131.1 DHA2 family efflux MFS transporter permease subunit [Mycetocola reblochoni]SJN22487.1 putative transport protein [Mycetocola reblochoni REB411]